MLYDTNILIASLRGDHTVIRALRNANPPLYISVITTIEILALPKLSKSEIVTIQDFLFTFVTIAVDERLAQEAAVLCRKFKLKVPDSIIAATAMYLHVPLVTRDKDFHRVKNLEIVDV